LGAVCVVAWGVCSEIGGPRRKPRLKGRGPGYSIFIETKICGSEGGWEVYASSL
jgi:hypothetical protein